MSTTSKAIKISIKRKLNDALKKYIMQNNISVEEISAKTDISLNTLQKIDKSKKLTSYCLYKILRELNLKVEIKLKKYEKKSCKSVKNV